MYTNVIKFNTTNIWKTIIITKQVLALLYQRFQQYDQAH